MKKIVFWTFMVLIPLFLINCEGDEIADVAETEETLETEEVETVEVETSETEETLAEQTDATLQESEVKPVPDSTAPVAPPDTNAYDKKGACVKDGNDITYKVYMPGIVDSSNACELDISTTDKQDDWSDKNDGDYCSVILDALVKTKEGEGYSCYVHTDIKETETGVGGCTNESSINIIKQELDPCI